MGENAWDAVVAICGAGGFTGTDILQEVRSRNPGLPVLVVSGTSAAGRPVASLMKVLTAMGREEIRPVPGPHGNAANKTTPAGLVAHDFGNILTAIIGFAEMANLEIDGKSPAKKNIAEILSAGERARGLFDRILALNR
jgi:signal transduction histidine kinase